jgi:uncharacterized protein YkwD
MARMSPAVMLISAALVLAIALAVSTNLRSLLRDEYDRASGTPTGQAPLYAADDAWRAWLAPESVCPGGEVPAAPQTEVTTMLCLINYARARQGLGPVALVTSLNTASLAKAGDIARCGRFEHAACGKRSDHDATAAGYAAAGAWGENLYVGEGRRGAPRVAMDEWLNSPPHRENLFLPQWRTAGLAAAHDATVDDFRHAVVWVSEFGDR